MKIMTTRHFTLLYLSKSSKHIGHSSVSNLFEPSGSRKTRGMTFALRETNIFYKKHDI